MLRTEHTNPDPPPDEPLYLLEVTEDDYPAVAALLTEAFTSGKYVTALGSDPAQRERLFGILLKHRALSKGMLYVARLPNAADVAGTVVVNYENDPIPQERRDAARAEIAAITGGLRARWAMAVLSLASSPALEPQSCYMDDLVVNPAYRRQRIAQRILHATFDIARERGKTEMLADIIPTNHRVVGLIKLEGWEILRRNYSAAPITLPLFGFASVYRIRKDLTAL